MEPFDSGPSMSGRPPFDQQPELDNSSTSLPPATTAPPILLTLPTEVIFMIVKCLCETQLFGNLGDAGLQALAAWARTCRFFNEKLEPELYDKVIIQNPYLLCWATDIGDLGLMRMVLAAKDAAILPQTGMLRFSPDHEYKELDRTEDSFELFKKHYRADGSFLQNDIKDNICDDDDDDGDFTAATYREDSGNDDRVYEVFNSYANSENDNAGVRYPEPASGREVYFDRNIAKVIRWNHGGNDQTQDNLQPEAAMYWFPVHIAARNSDIPALDLLLAHGAQLNMPSRGFCVDRRRPPRKRSPLSNSWRYPSNPSRKYPSWTPSHVALSRGHEETAIYILNKCRHISDRLLAPDETAKDRMPPFISAFRHGCFEAAEACLKKLADDTTTVDDATRLYLSLGDTMLDDPALGGRTLLYRVLHERGNFGRALDVLVRNGADVNRVEEGETPLVWACVRGHFKRALALVDAGARADVTVRTNFGEWGLGKLRGRGLVYVCCEESRLAAFRGRRFHWKGFKTSPASRRSAAALVDRVLAGKRTSRLVKDRWLSHAARNNQPEIMEVLLRHGADPNTASVGQERAPLEVLVHGIRRSEIDEHEHVEEVVKLLVEKLWRFSEPIMRALLLLIKEGVVDVNQRNGDGATCLADSVFKLDEVQRAGQPVRGPPQGQDELWEMWKCLVASERGLGDDWSRAMLQLLVEIDAEHRIFKEPRFLAKTMVGGQGCIIEALVDSAAPKLQLDASWRNSRGPTGFNPDHRLGWTLLHCAAYAGCVEVTKRLLQEGAPVVDAVMYNCFGELL
ncbi:tnni3 interacting kinase [Colletotrichum musicola]|uniref:Tnni3 interacting kinase n=1 Tax=Colletotrichum musicola TaxID=2175873 RepID=A0A8H6MMR5_9PEZI|nr:tnni3 interacting kinase [Colletotrichum musicola]